MEKITKDISLKGDDWFEVREKLYKKTFDTLYQLYVLCASLGIMYDKMKDTNDTEEVGLIPRTVQQNNIEELEILFQTAILTTSLVDYSEDERLELAFDDKTQNQDFDKIAFLTRFANFGAQVISEHLGDDSIECMENIKNLLETTVNGQNFDINPIEIEDLGISAEDLLEIS